MEWFVRSSLSSRERGHQEAAVALALSGRCIAYDSSYHVCDTGRGALSLNIVTFQCASVVEEEGANGSIGLRVEELWEEKNKPGFLCWWAKKGIDPGEKQKLGNRSWANLLEEYPPCTKVRHSRHVIVDELHQVWGLLHGVKRWRCRQIHWKKLCLPMPTLIWTLCSEPL